jgi:hypothetical protein
MNRPTPVGNTLGIPVTTIRPFKGYGTNLTDDAALPPSPEAANNLLKEVAKYGYNTIRVHHTSWRLLGPERAEYIKRAGYLLDACRDFKDEEGNPAPFYVVWTVASKDVNVDKAVQGDTAERKKVTDLLDALFSLDTGVIYLLELLNEENGTPEQILEFKAWGEKEARARGYEGEFLWQNDGRKSPLLDAARKVKGEHVYHDAARDGDSQTFFWNSADSDQHWITAEMSDPEAAALPHVMGEYGDISFSSLRMENELYMILQAKLRGFSAIYSYSFAGNWDHLKPGDKPINRFVTKTDNLRLAAQIVGRYVFMDESPVKTWVPPVGGYATTYKYETDNVLLEASGHPYDGTRRFKCMVSLDGQPLGKSKRFYVLSGGDYTMTDFEVRPWEEFDGTGNAGIRFTVTNPGTLPCLEGPGDDVQILNENDDLDAWGVDVQTLEKGEQSNVRRVDRGKHELEPRDRILQLVEAQG